MVSSGLTLDGEDLWITIIYLLFFNRDAMGFAVEEVKNVNR